MNYNISGKLINRLKQYLAVCCKGSSEMDDGNYLHEELVNLEANGENHFNNLQKAVSLVYPDALKAKGQKEENYKDGYLDCFNRFKSLVNIKDDNPVQSLDYDLIIDAIEGNMFK